MPRRGCVPPRYITIALESTRAIEGLRSIRGQTDRRTDERTDVEHERTFATPSLVSDMVLHLASSSSPLLPSGLRQKYPPLELVFKFLDLTCKS